MFFALIKGVEAENTSLCILALGDSYTFGEGVESKDRWTDQLQEQLRAQGITVEAIDMIARSGWTSQELLAAIPQSNPRGPYDLVTILIGTNDQFQGRDPQLYRQDLTQILRQAVALAGNDPKRVFVVSLPDWSVSPYAVALDQAAVSSEINIFNDIALHAAEDVHARWIDITTRTRQRTDPAMYTIDGLHPAAALYKEWVSVILPQTLSVLQK